VRRAWIGMLLGAAVLAACSDSASKFSSGRPLFFDLHRNPVGILHCRSLRLRYDCAAHKLTIRFPDGELES
jgi:hypothetical protein